MMGCIDDATTWWRKTEVQQLGSSIGKRPRRKASYIGQRLDFGGILRMISCPFGINSRPIFEENMVCIGERVVRLYLFLNHAENWW